MISESLQYNDLAAFIIYEFPDARNLQTGSPQINELHHRDLRNNRQTEDSCGSFAVRVGEGREFPTCNDFFGDTLNGEIFNSLKMLQFPRSINC